MVSLYSYNYISFNGRTDTIISFVFRCTLIITYLLTQLDEHRYRLLFRCTLIITYLLTTNLHGKITG